MKFFKIFRIRFSISISVALVLIVGCSKDSSTWNLDRNNPNDTKSLNRAPIVKTGSVIQNFENEFLAYGEILFTGSSNRITFGHCWSTEPMPTISNSKTSMYFGDTVTYPASYNSTFSVLPQTTYYIRSYATNSNGTAYGEQVIHTSLDGYRCIYYNCNSIDSFNTFVYQIGSSSNTTWEVGTGYFGNGLELSRNSYGGYIEFEINLEKSSKMKFWTMSISPGNYNSYPIVYIDESVVNIKKVNGTFYDFMELETGYITPGNHKVKIDFPRNSLYNSYFIDEISFWCN